MKYITTVSLLVLIVPIYIASPTHILALNSSINAFLAGQYENVSISLAIYGNVTNLGDKPIPINETDIMVFDYPLKRSDQRVYSVRAWVNNEEYNYTVYPINSTHYILVIESPYFNETLDPGETISVGVEYYVSINMRKRVETITDFLATDDPYTLLPKAGEWEDVKPYVNKTTIGITGLWNYSHPLIKLLNKYIETTIVKTDKPLAYLLGVLNWFDENIVYSTRIPPRFPWEAIVEGAGDCDDQSNLLITLLRLKGIPAYLETGMVYISESYRFEDTGAGGYYRYKFIGGGGHGWVVAYIPPWGWIRVDPIVRTDLLTGKKAPLYKVAIKYALYYWFPTVVTDKIFRKDYVESSVKAVEALERVKLKYDIVLEMHLLSRGAAS